MYKLSALGNIFTGANQSEDAKLTGIEYTNGGSGECAKNSFINFKNPDQPPVKIFSSLGGVGPRLMDNKFTGCVASNNSDHEFRGVSSTEDETRINNMTGDNVKRGDIRFCCYCEKPGPCVLCNGCKTEYYCDEECQKQDWKSHQEFCTSYSKAKDK